MVIFLQTMMKYVKLCFLVSLFVLASCSRSNFSETSPPKLAAIALNHRAGCSSGLKAFETSVHALYRRDCLPCHDKGGIGPGHGVADVEKSYDLTLSYVNWGNLSASKLIHKGGDQHCRLKPGNPPGDQCVSTKADLVRELQKWWEEGQKDCPNFGNYVTPPLNLLATPQWFPLSWQLGPLNPELFGVTLEMDIRAEGNAFLLRKPILKGLAFPVRMEKFYLILNGEIIDSPFTFVKAISMPEGEWGSAVLSSSTVTLPVEKLQGNRLAIGFDVLAKSEPITCKEKDFFKNEVLPGIEKRKNCYRCHGGPEMEGEPVARSRFDMKVPEDTLCNSFLNRGNGRFLAYSPLIAYPLKGANGHPIAIPVESEVLPAWTNWLMAERKHFPSWREIEVPE